MRLAVVITTCDRPQMLRRALASVAAQGLQPDELIVVNDGMGEVDVPAASVLRSGPYAGPSAARNLGAASSDADVLCFLDDDDEWHPDYTTAVSERLLGSELVLTAFMKVHRDGRLAPEKVPPSSLRVADWVVQNQGLRGSNLAIRRQAFLAVNGFDDLMSCGEDMDLAIRAAEAQLSYEREVRPLVIYHTHDGVRLTSRGSRHRQAHRTWLVAQRRHMGESHIREYGRRTAQLFGVDLGREAVLIWVLGPPGAGKTSWAHRCAAAGDRVMDVEDILFWRDGADKGVRTAKRHIVDAIRSVEGGRAERSRRLFVTAAYLDLEDLGVLEAWEHVVAVVPPPAVWRRRLSGRDGEIRPAHMREYSRWAERLGVGAHASDLLRRSW